RPLPPPPSGRKKKSKKYKGNRSPSPSTSGRLEFGVGAEELSEEEARKRLKIEKKARKAARKAAARERELQRNIRNLSFNRKSPEEREPNRSSSISIPPAVDETIVDAFSVTPSEEPQIDLPSSSEPSCSKSKEHLNPTSRDASLSKSREPSHAGTINLSTSEDDENDQERPSQQTQDDSDDDIIYEETIALQTPRVIDLEASEIRNQRRKRKRRSTT
ncbi:hypothetical protein PFISCL1PPCAC_27174, partial [Pristionchus fissidentatus]